MPVFHRNRLFRVLGLPWAVAMLLAGTFTASLVSGTAVAADVRFGAQAVVTDRSVQVPCGGSDSIGPLPSGDQSIGGLVTNTSSSPLADVRVYIESPGEGRDSVVTNAQGRYVFEGLGDATYFVSFFDETGTYQSSYYDGADVAVTREAATGVVLSGGGAATINAALPADSRSTISGVVTDVDGQGVGGVQVDARGTYFGGLASCALTDGDGSYEILDVRAGAYGMRAYAEGSPLATPSDPSVIVPPNAGTVDFQFPQVHVLAGSVLDADGAPVDSITVSASPVGGGEGGSTAFGADNGLFEVGGLVAGSYIIRYDDGSGLGRYRTGYYGGEGVWVATEAEAVPVVVPGGPITLAVVTAPRVNGTITTPGPLPSGSIYVGVCDELGENCFGASADDLGAYSIGILVPGTYTASAYDQTGTYLSGYIGSGGTISLDPNDAVSIVVDETDVGPINAALPEGGHISAHVDVAGVGFGSAYVQICLDEFQCPDGFNTDGIGDGTSLALWPGTYYVSGMGDGPAYWFDTDGPESLDFANATPIVVTTASTESVALDLPAVGSPTDDGGPGVVAPVEVEPDDGSGNTPVSVTFPDVTASGTTSLTTSDSYDGDPIPTGFQVGLPAFYFDLTTTAEYATPIVVCVTYVETSYTDEANLRLFHFDGSWVDITVLPVDTDANRICGSTSSLSPFALAERTYQFSGFRGPRTPPNVNDAKSGSTIGLQFGLGGDFGLDVFAAGTPTTQQVDCATGAAIGISSAATGSLKYSEKKDTYTYSWVTLKAWKSSCREVTLTLRDGTVASLWYRLKA